MRGTRPANLRCSNVRNSCGATERKLLMDKEHLKGEAKKAEGHVKDGVGKMTGNEKLQAEGKMDKAEGEVRKKVGDVKDAFKKK
jgi:uncharacterized protein YjbJ (UPF0337 family)